MVTYVVKGLFVLIRLKVSEIFASEDIINKSQLAREMGMSRNNINNLLGNDTPASIELASIEKICKRFGVTPNDLFEILNDDGTEWKP